MEFTCSLKENRQFRRLYAKGKSGVSPTLVIYYRKNGSEENFLGITVSGKLGNAVVRNKIRRRLKEIYRSHEGEFLKGHHIVVVARVRACNVSYAELEKHFLQVAFRCKLLKPKEE